MYKLNLLCAKDALHPQLQHILITKEYIWATDGHVLGKVETSYLIKNPEDIGDKRILVHKDNWKAIISHKTEFIEIVNQDNKTVLLCENKNKISINISTDNEDNVGKYPNCESVINKDKVEKKVININPNNLKRITDCFSITVLSLNFMHNQIHIYDNGYTALLMPLVPY